MFKYIHTGRGDFAGPARGMPHRPAAGACPCILVRDSHASSRFINMFCVFFGEHMSLCPCARTHITSFLLRGSCGRTLPLYCICDFVIEGKGHGRLDARISYILEGKHTHTRAGRRLGVFRMQRRLRRAPTQVQNLLAQVSSLRSKTRFT